jgi:phosphopantothenoylcysteine decarboxylase/phosphopantothenate--cysteine ligase
MGVALAEAAAARGADVTLIAANVSIPTGPAVTRIDVVSAAELADATRTAFPTSDLLIMAAAVADFRPADEATGKIAREGSGGLSLELEQTDDVLAALAAERADGQVLVGFAAEHGGDFVSRAREKLGRKGVDAIVVNDVSDSSIGFDSEQNEVTVVTASGETDVPRGSKREVAAAVLDAIGAL